MASQIMLSLLTMAAGLHLFRREHPEYEKERGYPPALTDLARESNLASNLSVASISVAATMFISVADRYSDAMLSKLLALSGAAGFITTAVCEGNNRMHEHAGGLLVGVAALVLWFLLYGPNLRDAKHKTLAYVFFATVVGFCYLFSIRKRSNGPETRRRFVWGEYIAYFFALPVLIYLLAP